MIKGAITCTGRGAARTGTKDRYQTHARTREHTPANNEIRPIVVFSARGKRSIMRETPRVRSLFPSPPFVAYVPGLASCRAPEEHFEYEPITICVRLTARLSDPYYSRARNNLQIIMRDAPRSISTPPPPISTRLKSALLASPYTRVLASTMRATTMRARVCHRKRFTVYSASGRRRSSRSCRNKRNGK